MHAEKIKALRNSAGLNQYEFGALFGVSKATISRWEKGSVNPTPYQSNQLGHMAEAAPRKIKTLRERIARLGAFTAFLGSL